MIKRLKELYRAAKSQFGIDPSLMLAGLRAFPAYLADYRKFRKKYGGRIEFMPCLHDRDTQSGDVHSEYFLQDLEIAKRIFMRAPFRHVDVGSRVDGFVAHVASFRTVEVLDIRPTSAVIPGIEFIQADLMTFDRSRVANCDSLSCLHALEHFGLGRYGDEVDPDGWQLGINSLANILQIGGRLYLSVPVGRETVAFNAHRIFAPLSLIAAGKSNKLELAQFSWVADGRLHNSKDFSTDLAALSDAEYALGIFEFIKV